MKNYCWSIILFMALFLPPSALRAEESSSEINSPATATATTTIEADENDKAPKDNERPAEPETSAAQEEVAEGKKTEEEGAEDKEPDEQAQAMPAKVGFFDPWLNSDLSGLTEFLEQNWTFSKQLKQSRQLKLAIIEATSTDRHLRSNAELLSREPGFLSVYSSLCLFRELVKIQLEVNQNLYDTTSQLVLKREITTEQAVELLQKNQVLNKNLLQLLLKLTDSTREFLSARVEQSRQNQHISPLLAKLRQQKIQLLELFIKSNAEHKKLLKQIYSIYSSVDAQLNYLNTSKATMAVKTAARLVKVGNLFLSCKKMAQAYRKPLVKLAVDFYRLNEEHFASLTSMAQNSIEQQAAIANARNQFPERDLHPAAPQKFSYIDFFAEACEVLSGQVELANQDNKQESAALVTNVTDFFHLFHLLNSSHENYSGFRELFDTIYNPETIEARPADD